MGRIAIFASGRGSNASKIIEYIREVEGVEVALIVSNREKAGVLDIARKEGIAHEVIKKEELSKSTSILKEHKIDSVVLAGFLLKIPESLIRAFPEQIVNIHPALLPKYGGKGMYGKHVHQAVHDNKDNESGITIHLVNEKYDEGEILFQASVELSEKDDPDSIASKVLELEHYYYPRVIEAFVLNQSE